jgi:hypothetical protein
MRNPDRIPIILERLKKLWEKYPDMRLAQLIGNVYPCTEYTRIDAYYTEDEEYISNMEKMYAKENTFRVGGKKDLKKILDEVKKK